MEILVLLLMGFYNVTMILYSNVLNVYLVEIDSHNNITISWEGGGWERVTEYSKKEYLLIIFN